MPWWVLAYLLLLVLLSVAGWVDDARDRKPRWWLAWAGLSAVASVTLVLAYWAALPARIPAVGLASLLALAVVFDTVSAVADLNHTRRDPDTASTVVAVLGSFLLVLVMLPAYGWGVLAVLRAG